MALGCGSAAGLDRQARKELTKDEAKPNKRLQRDASTASFSNIFRALRLDDGRSARLNRSVVQFLVKIKAVKL